MQQQALKKHFSCNKANQDKARGSHRSTLLQLPVVKSEQETEAAITLHFTKPNHAETCLSHRNPLSSKSQGFNNFSKATPSTVLAPSLFSHRVVTSRKQRQGSNKVCPGIVTKDPIPQATSQLY